MKYAILRTQKLKNFANVKGCADHHSRSRETENANPKIKNQLLIGSGDPYNDVRKKIDESGAHYRSNSNKAIEVLLAASPEYFRPSAPEKAGCYEKQPTDAFKQRATRWLQEYFGKDNVVSAILHLDEATPHIQAIIVPIDNTPRKIGPQVRLNAKRWTGDSKKLAKMQDSFASAVKDLGLERGVKGSTAKHAKISQIYGEINKKAETIKIPKIELPDTYLTANAKKTYAKLQNDKIFKELKPQLSHIIKSSKLAKIADKKRKEYQETASKLQNENEQLKAENEQLKIELES
ncbi:MAG: MobV family relaxase, partial [Bacteroidota bacterium]